MKHAPPRLVQSPDAIRAIAQTLRGVEMVAVDTEFVRETTFFPKVGLLQIATEKETWLIDPLALDAKALGPLFEVLKAPEILKVMHAAYADQECFYWAYGFVAEPVLDTSIGAALCGLGDSIGLGKLVKEAFQIVLPKGRARTKWLNRPLGPELLHYAEQDVLHLVRLGQWLRDRLKKKDRWDWALEESRVDESTLDVSPEDMARRLLKNGRVSGKAVGVLVELVRWREQRARSGNMPRGWVADNDTLMDLARVAPSRVEELRTFRGLNGREADKSGRAILEAIERGRHLKFEGFVPLGFSPSDEKEDHLSVFVKTYISFLADSHGIANRFLLQTGRATALVRMADCDISEWVKAELLSERAADLIGAELKALLCGEKGLAIQDGQVVILDLRK